MELNNRQIEAVTTTEGYLRVIAGAGSGKTRMLVSRYVYLVKEIGITPNSVMCLTFSNKAALEMRKRIKKLLNPDADVSFVTTYHGLCARIIRDNSKYLLFPNNYRIIDNTAQKQILQEIYEEMGLKLNDSTFEEIITKIGVYKSDLKYISYMISRDEENEKNSDSVIARYLYHQKKYFLVDFEDLINYGLYLLTNFKDVRDYWQNKINYLLIDEFQDSTVKELAIVEELSGKYKNLLVVGDPDQNIYEWRGSKMELLVDFDKSHQPTKTIIMDQNYRSTTPILTCANSLIKHNKVRLDKNLYTLNEKTDKPLLYIANNGFKEADWVIGRIKMLHEVEKQKYSEIVILARTSYLFSTFEKKLMEANIPYEIYGSVKFFQRKEVVDIMAYLRLIDCEDDDCFKRVVNVPKRGFGKMALKRLKAMQTDKSLYATLKDNFDQLGNPQLANFIDMIEHCKTMVNDLPGLKIFDEVLEQSGYDKYMRELGDMQRLNNLTELKRLLLEQLNDSPEVSLNDLLNFITLQNDKEDEVENVKLMTIHSSKGLEFNNVFVVGFVEGIFPSPKTIEERLVAGLEEERRLCYVAITRAKEKLYLTASTSYYGDEKGRDISRFISEIGEENLEIIGEKKAKKQSVQFKYDIGDVVSHAILGKGTVKSIDRRNRCYEIQFENIANPRMINCDYNFGPVEDDVIIIEKEKSTIFQSDDWEEGEIVEEEEIEAVIEDEKEDEVEELIEAYTLSFSDDFEELKENTINSNSLWEDPNVPKNNWVCIGITDLGKPEGECQMCNNAIIRYVHHMRHEDYPYILNVGCICASKMESDGSQAIDRERMFKNRLQRRKNFLKRKFKKSRSGNEYIKHKDDVYCLYLLPNSDEEKYLIYNSNGRLNKTSYKSRNAALSAIFDDIEEKR